MDPHSQMPTNCSYPEQADAVHIQVPNIPSTESYVHFLCLGRTKVSVQVRDSRKHFLTGYVFRVRSCQQFNYVINTTNLMHPSLPLHFIDVQCLNISICFGHYLPFLRRHYTDAELVAIVCSCRCGLVSGYKV
jgi:hypothetical protein